MSVEHITAEITLLGVNNPIYYSSPNRSTLRRAKKDGITLEYNNIVYSKNEKFIGPTIYRFDNLDYKLKRQNNLLNLITTMDNEYNKVYLEGLLYNNEDHKNPVSLTVITDRNYEKSYSHNYNFILTYDTNKELNLGTLNIVDNGQHNTEKTEARIEKAKLISLKPLFHIIDLRRVSIINDIEFNCCLLKLQEISNPDGHKIVVNLNDKATFSNINQSELPETKLNIDTADTNVLNNLSINTSTPFSLSISDCNGFNLDKFLAKGVSSFELSNCRNITINKLDSSVVKNDGFGSCFEVEIDKYIGNSFNVYSSNIHIKELVLSPTDTSFELISNDGKSRGASITIDNIIGCNTSSIDFCPNGGDIYYKGQCYSRKRSVKVV